MSKNRIHKAGGTHDGEREGPVSSCRTVFLFLVIAAVCLCPQRSQAGARDIRIGAPFSELSALIWIAQDQGYFAEQGLNPRFFRYESGNYAANDLLKGNLDVTVCTEFAALMALIGDPRLRIITGLKKVRDIEIVARKNHAISQIADLKNKKIGLVRGSNAEFFLDQFCLLNNIRPSEIQTCDLSPPDQLKAIGEGRIDAAIVWFPYTHMIRRTLGANAVWWDAQSQFDYNQVLITRSDIVEQHPGILEKFCLAAMKAENYVHALPDEAREILKRNLETHDIDQQTWDADDVRLALDRHLIVTMESQFRWMKDKNPAPDKKTPNFLNYIAFGILEKLDPKRVKIRR